MKTNQWSTYYLSMPRRRPAAVAWGSSRLMVCGGYTRGVELQSCEVVPLENANDNNNDDDLKIPDMQHARDSAKAVLYRNRFMIVLGGEDGSRKNEAGVTVEVLDLNTILQENNPNNAASWITLPCKMKRSRSYIAATIVAPNDMLVVAGRTDMEVLDLRPWFDENGIVASTTNNNNPLAEFRLISSTTLPVDMGFMGMVAVPIVLKEQQDSVDDDDDEEQGQAIDKDDKNVAVAFFLANGNKENQVLALDVPSFQDFLSLQDQEENEADIEEGNPNQHQEPESKDVAQWHTLPILSVPYWRVDLVLVGDSLLAIGDTWIERLQLSSTRTRSSSTIRDSDDDNQRNQQDPDDSIFEPLDFAIPKQNWLTKTLFHRTPPPGPRVTTISVGPGGMQIDNGNDPRLRNAIICILLVWFLFFRNWRPGNGGGGGGRTLGGS